jgi:hypothetical protein
LGLPTRTETSSPAVRVRLLEVMAPKLADTTAKSSSVTEYARK